MAPSHCAHVLQAKTLQCAALCSSWGLCCPRGSPSPQHNTAGSNSYQLARRSSGVHGALDGCLCLSVCCPGRACQMQPAVSAPCQPKGARPTVRTSGRDAPDDQVAFHPAPPPRAHRTTGSCKDALV